MLNFNKKITQSNTLVNACYSINFSQMRVIYYLLSTFRSKNKISNRKIAIKIPEFAKFYDMLSKRLYTDLPKYCKSLQKEPLRVNEKTIYWFEDVKIFKGGKEKTKEKDFSNKLVHIEVTLTEAILPFISGLKGNFTSVNSSYLTKLNLFISSRLYWWLTNAKNKSNQKENRFYWRIPLQKFKEMLTGVNKDINDEIIKTTVAKRIERASKEEWADFKRKLNKAIDDINLNTEYYVYFTEHKVSRKVESITFNGVVKDINTNIKPIRPKLNKSTKVKKGSHADGIWQKTNIKLLENYIKELKNWNPHAELHARDLERLITYYKNTGDNDYRKNQLKLLLITIKIIRKTRKHHSYRLAFFELQLQIWYLTARY